jgi:hypothetical protein
MPRNRFDDDDDDRRPPPSAKIRVKDPKPKNTNDPPPVKVRAHEEDDPEYDRPQFVVGDGAEFDARGRRVNRRRQRTFRLIFNITLGLTFLGVFIAGICLLLWSMRNPPPDPEMIAFVPPDTRFLCGIRVEEARYNETFRQKLDSALPRVYPPEFKYVLDELKLSPADVNRVMFATNAPSLSLSNLRGMGADLTAIFKMNSGSELSRKKLAQLTNAEEVQYGSKKYFRVASPSFCFYLPSPRMIVICNSESLMTKMLDKDDYDIVIKGNLKDLTDTAGGDHYWFVSDSSTLSPLSMAFDPTEGKAFAFWGGIHDKKIHFNGAVMFPNESIPREIEKSFSEVMRPLRELSGDDGKVVANAFLATRGASADSNTAEAIYQALTSMSVSQSGNMLTGSFRVSTSIIVDMMNNGVKISRDGRQGSYTHRPQFPFEFPPFDFFSQGQAFFPPQFGGGGAPAYGPNTGGIPVGIRP